MTSLIDLTGNVYGRLTVTGRADVPGPVRWLCRCECGTETVALGANLRKGNTRSCGCLRVEMSRESSNLRPRPRSGHASYDAAHLRVRTDRGKASYQPCADCEAPAVEWSYDHTDPDEITAQRGKYEVAYSLKPEHYSPRCKSCHVRFDREAHCV